MSLCPVVDENDRIIGHKLRSQLDPQKDCYRATALWVTNTRGQVLIAQRHKSKDKYPEKWGPAVAGTVEKDETYESNIYKEAEEELGMHSIPFTIGPKMKFEHPRKHFTQWYTAIFDWEASAFMLQPTEVEKVAWVDLNDLIDDHAKHSDKYVPSMGLALDAFTKA